MSSSYSASGSATNLSSRPRPSRQRSNLTPDFEYPDPLITAIPTRPSSSRGGGGPSTPSRGSTPYRPGSGAGMAVAAGSKSESANHSRRRSLSTGSFGSPIHSEGGYNLGTSRLGWVPGLETVSPGRIGWERDGTELNGEEDGNASLLDNAMGLMRRLKEINRKESAGKGKGKEAVEDAGRKDEAWSCMTQLAALLKRSEGLKGLLGAEEVTQT
jgi:hypothetical protein